MNIYKRMELVLNEIPRGSVATYGQIALLCGKPGNARQVGYALNHGLAGAHVPAHRVVNHRGVLSGALSFETPDQQPYLLRGEGVETVWTPEGYCVDLKRYGWKNTMDDARKLRMQFEQMNI